MNTEQGSNNILVKVWVTLLEPPIALGPSLALAVPGLGVLEELSFVVDEASALEVFFVLEAADDEESVAVGDGVSVAFQSLWQLKKVKGL
jgi:hypothetical protein